MRLKVLPLPAPPAFTIRHESGKVRIPEMVLRVVPEYVNSGASQYELRACHANLAKQSVVDRLFKVSGVEPTREVSILRGVNYRSREAILPWVVALRELMGCGVAEPHACIYCLREISKRRFLFVCICIAHMQV
jgi:hypothetical protein